MSAEKDVKDVEAEEATQGVEAWLCGHGVQHGSEKKNIKSCSCILL